MGEKSAVAYTPSRVQEVDDLANSERSRVPPFPITERVGRHTQFTEEHEERLRNCIASKIPCKEAGGRTGNRLYMRTGGVHTLSLVFFHPQLTGVLNRAVIQNMSG